MQTHMFLRPPEHGRSESTRVKSRNLFLPNLGYTFWFFVYQKVYQKMRKSGRLFDRRKTKKCTADLAVDGGSMIGSPEPSRSCMA